MHKALLECDYSDVVWMPREDSNLDKRYQKPVSYH